MKDWIKKTIAEEDEKLNNVKIVKNKIIIIINFTHKIEI